MQDCMVCLSAGSVNQWGVCEVCGEELEDLSSVVSGVAGNNVSQITAEP